MDFNRLAPLSGRQERFVAEYLRDARPKAAAVRAGYSEKSASRIAWRLLHDPLVAAHIRAAQRNRSERLRVTTDRIVLEHSRIALADIGRIVRLTRKGPKLRARDEVGPDESAAVREVIRRKGGFHLKLYDKTKSLAVLTEMLGIVQRFQTDSRQAEEERIETEKVRAKFNALIDQMRARLNIDTEVSRFEALAEGVARGDDEAVALAQKGGFLDQPGAPGQRG